MMATNTCQSCTDLLATMVGFDTVNSRISGRPNAELKLAEFLDAQATAMGLTTRRLPIQDPSFNLLVLHQTDDSAPWLLFESHLDTVSVEGMTIDPFAARIENGRMYGRGACDTKGTGASMLWALQQYSGDLGGANNVAIVFTLDEEAGKGGIKAFVNDQMPKLDWRPTGAIVGEPTMLKAVTAHNGVVRWKIRTEGRAAHSCDPSRGLSAISMMAKVVQAIESRYIAHLTAHHPLTGKAQGSINIIHGGAQINIIPESCEIDLDRRVAPGEQPEDVTPAVEKVLDELRRDDPAMNVRQLPAFLDAPLDPTGGEAFIDTVRDVLDQMDLDAAPSGVPYCTDASNLSRAGIPTIVLGPGDIAQAHTADEWIELDQLDRGVEVYLNLMRTPLGKSR